MSLPAADDPMVVAFTTVATEEAADRLASRLVDERLAACVQIDPPIRSVYVWQDQVQRETEYRLVIKTTASAARVIEANLTRWHPYDTPQWAVIGASGSAGYEEWLRKCVCGPHPWQP